MHQLSNADRGPQQGRSHSNQGAGLFWKKRSRPPWGLGWRSESNCRGRIPCFWKRCRHHWRPTSRRGNAWLNGNWNWMATRRRGHVWLSGSWRATSRRGKVWLTGSNHTPTRDIAFKKTIEKVYRHQATSISPPKDIQKKMKKTTCRAPDTKFVWNKRRGTKFPKRGEELYEEHWEPLENTV